MLLFQSAPPVETRGDTCCSSRRYSLADLNLFQSAPPVETRGDTRSRQSAVAQFMMFQSAPPVETRGDRKRNVRPRRSAKRSSFNPLPPSKRGETRILRAEPSPDRRNVSIRSPVETRGDCPDTRLDSLRTSQIVSIRSPRRNEGRLATLTHIRFKLALNSVSIRSPRRNEGRRH